MKIENPNNAEIKIYIKINKKTGKVDWKTHSSDNLSLLEIASALGVITSCYINQVRINVEKEDDGTQTITIKDVLWG